MSKVGIIGIGLIGGSIAKALPSEVVVYDASSHALQAASGLGIETASSVDELVNTVDTLVIGVPFEAFDSVFASVQSAAARREKPILVTNVLSVMNPVEVTEPNVEFVASHPMAGTEFSGFEAAKADLFEGATWVLAKANDQLAGLVAKLGAKPVVVDPSKHNAIVSQVSHMPHVLAAAQILALPDDSFYSLAASSFRDSTRVAATAPELTGSMVGNNSEEVLHAMKRLSGVLDEFIEVLESGDQAALEQLFARANSQRSKHY
jgi:prephenate dehydrogenase